MFHYVDGGLNNIWLANGYEIKDTPYGNSVTIRDLSELIAAVCCALVRKTGGMSGAELRYIRQALRMSQTALGNVIGKTEQSVANWEKNNPVPKYADIIVRTLYTAHADGNKPIKNLVYPVDEASQLVGFIMHKSKTGWTSEATREPVSNKELECI